MMFRQLRKLVPNLFIRFIKDQSGTPSQHSSFLRLQKLGFEPKTILDIGAYEGNWSAEIRSIFKNAYILMIEGQVQKETILRQKVKLLGNTEFKIALLGASAKEVEFNIYETASSIFSEDNETNARKEIITLTKLDDLLAKSPIREFDLIKIDTQGSELEILKGGKRTLDAAQAVLLETSFLGIYKEAPLFSDVVQYMKNRGFVVYDICSLMRRPYDSALFQADILFLKEDLKLRASTRWT